MTSDDQESLPLSRPVLSVSGGVCCWPQECERSEALERNDPRSLYSAEMVLGCHIFVVFSYFIIL
jgi:hypothetical protein